MDYKKKYLKYKEKYLKITNTMNNKISGGRVKIDYDKNRINFKQFVDKLGDIKKSKTKENILLVTYMEDCVFCKEMFLRNKKDTSIFSELIDTSEKDTVYCMNGEEYFDAINALGISLLGFPTIYKIGKSELGKSKKNKQEDREVTVDDTKYKVDFTGLKITTYNGNRTVKDLEKFRKADI